MTASDARTELGRMLSELKERRGVSYQALSRRVHLSKSAVHRYCSGGSAPADFGTIERIGRATGATRRELEELFRLWSSAVVRDEPAQPPGERRIGDKERSASEYPGRNASAPASARPVELAVSRPYGEMHRRPRRLIAAMALATLLGVFVIINGPLQASERSTTGSIDLPWTSGATWTLSAEPVARQMFGVTINSTTGNMPGFEIGAVRLWDSGTLWARLQPRPDRFDWTPLDRQVNGAEAAGLPVLFVIGGTPGWAAPAGPRAPYPEDARAVPPDDLAHWDGFVTALAKRYAGRIEAYELWVLATDKRFYNGTVENLIEMTRRANRIIERADPAATVVCPGMGNLWTSEGRDTLRRFAELGGYDHCDVAGVKLYQRSAAEPPETMLQLLSGVDEILHAAGVHPRLWNTGTTYTIPLQGKLDATTARNYAVRFYLVGLLARKSFVERMYFYNWGGVRIPIVLQADGGPLTPAARALEALQRWLSDAQVTSCGQGRAADLPPNAWRCRFTLAAGAGASHASIVWTHDGTATINAAAGGASVQRLDGSSSTVASGAPLTVGEEPVLIRQNP